MCGRRYTCTVYTLEVQYTLRGYNIVINRHAIICVCACVWISSLIQLYILCHCASSHRRKLEFRLYGLYVCVMLGTILLMLVLSVGSSTVVHQVSNSLPFTSTPTSGKWNVSHTGALHDVITGCLSCPSC